MLLKNKMWIWLLLLIFLAGNIGVAVNKHICYSEGIVEFYFSSENISCSEHNEQSNHVAACCKKPAEDADCCNDDVVYSVLDIDQFRGESKPFVAEISATVLLLFSHFSFDCMCCNTFTCIDTGAPPLWQFQNSLSFLSFISVFRI